MHSYENKNEHYENVSNKHQITHSVKKENFMILQIGYSNLFVIIILIPFHFSSNWLANIT